MKDNGRETILVGVVSDRHYFYRLCKARRTEGDRVGQEV